MDVTQPSTEVAAVHARLRLDTSEAKRKLRSEMIREGESSAREFTRSFKKTTEHLPTAKLKMDIDLDSKTIAKAKSDVERISTQLASARSKEANATGLVRVQELKLNELRESGKTKASALLSAEERLASGRRRLAEASDLVTKSTDKMNEAQLRAEQSEKRLADGRRRLAEADRINQSIASKSASLISRSVSNGISGASSGISLTAMDFSTTGVAIKAALVGGAVAASPLVGAAVGAAVLGGVAAAGIGAGIALQFQDPQVKQAGQLLAIDLKAKFVEASAGIKAPLLSAMDAFGQRIDAQLPRFNRMFDQAGKYLTPLADGLGQAFDNMMPGIEKALTDAAPVINQLSQSIPGIGSAIGEAFETIGDHADDIALGVKVIIDLTGEGIKFAADGVAFLADSVHDIVSLLANANDLVADMNDSKGTFSKINNLGGILDPTGQGQKQGDEQSNKYRERADSLRKYLQESDRANAASAKFTKTQQEQAPVVDKVTSSIDAATIQFNELAEKAGTPAEKINALTTVGKQFAGSTGASGQAAQLFAGALIAEGVAATNAVDRVNALKAAHEILNGTRRASIDATESFKSGLLGLKPATDEVATAEAQRAEANKQHALGVANALKQVPTAEQALVDAQTRAKDAQLSLTQARRDAVAQLRDMKESVSDLALSEEGASISLERARANLTRVNQDSKASELDRRQALLDVKLAEDSLKDTQEQRRLKTGELRAAERGGIDNMPGVVAAQQAQKASLDAVKQASDGVKEALAAVQEAQRKTTESTNITSTSLSTNSVAGLQNRDMLQDLIKKNEDSYFANIANGDSVEAARKKYDTQAKAIENTAVKAGFNRGEVKKLNTEYGLIPGTRETDLKTKGFATVYKELKRLQFMQSILSLNMTPEEAEAAFKRQDYPSGSSGGFAISKAMGGYISGPGGPTGDKIPAWLSDNEFVQPAHSVDYYGVGAMEAIRTHAIPKEILQGFAKGGQVLRKGIDGAFKFATGGRVSKIPITVDVSKTKIPSSSTGESSYGGTPGNAFNTANAMGASAKVMLALFETGLVESGMKNLASRRVPESLKYPHEGVARGDHDSVGFLQQRAGWGSVKSRMNVADSTRRFVHKAKAKEDRFDTAGELAQAVQVSAYPKKYNARQKAATALLDKVRGSVVIGGGGGSLEKLGWPSSPSAQRGDSGVHRKVVAAIKASGIKQGSFGNAYRHGDPRWHGSGRAVDWMGYNMDELASYFMARKGSVLELIHRTKKRDYAITRGVNKGSFNESLMNAHKNHIHLAFAKGGLVKLPAAARRPLEAEEANAVQLAASGRPLNARQVEIIRGMDEVEVNTLKTKLPAGQFSNVQKRLSGSQMVQLEAFQTRGATRKIPGLTGAQEAAINDAVNGGTITPAHRKVISKLTPANIISLARAKIPWMSLSRLRPFLTPVQQAALDSTRTQRLDYANLRTKLPGATKSAVARSASGGSLTSAQKRLLGGLSSQQIAAFRDTMSDSQWKNFTADLTPSQRRDTTSVLRGDVKERDNAISKAREAAKPVVADPNKTLQDLTALTKDLKALANKPSVVFSGQIGSNTSLAAAYQQANFWARSAGG